MSLGLPDFGSLSRSDSGGGSWPWLRTLGFVALLWALAVAGREGWSAYSQDLALDRAGAEVAAASRSNEETRRLLRRHADLLVATASLESSPDRVLADIRELLPDGVSLTALKLDYLPDATTRIDFSVVARTPNAYDRFLTALSGSPAFSDIKPGSESRPGLLKASLSAIHRPGGAVR